MTRVTKPELVPSFYTATTQSVFILLLDLLTSTINSTKTLN